METTYSSLDNEKIDFYKILNIYRIKNKIGFRSYLVYIWKDLTLRSENGNKGINKITFAKYYELPGLIQDQLFNVFSSYSNYIQGNNFVSNMMILFTKEYEDLISFIFKMYDFDCNGKISKEDIRVLLSYIPLNRPTLLSNNQTDEFENRIATQEELHNNLDLIFNERKYINENEFREIIENKNSDIFLYLVILLFEKAPFNKRTIEILEKLEKSQNYESKDFKKKTQFIKSPSYQTLFKPCYGLLSYVHFIEKICNIKITNLNKNKINENKYLRRKNRLLTFQISNKKKLENYLDNNKKNKSLTKNNEFKRNNKKNHTYISKLAHKELKKLEELNEQNSIDSFISFSDNEFNESINEEENKNLFPQIQEKIRGNYSGYVYKLIEGLKMKKLYCVLNFKDIFYYKRPNDLAFVGIDNLSNINYRTEGKVLYKNTLLYKISLISSEKIIHFFIETKEEYLEWIKNLELSIIKYNDIKEKYELKKIIEDGKFGTIRKGINKITKEEIVVTSMSKEDMNFLDLKQFRNEIEILKIGNHPYIGTLYDVYETCDYLYKITKYYKGGDLLLYFKKRNFHLSEKRCAEIIRQIAVVIYYLQSFGIIHGDLKPENILMTDDSDNADIKILDFFSGQFIGESEYLGYGIGTIPYTAPEFLLKKPVNKKIDLWSLGIISYFLLSGILPFEYNSDDDDNNNNNNNNNDNNNDISDDIEKRLINDEVLFPEKYWKNISYNAKDFVESNNIFFII